MAIKRFPMFSVLGPIVGLCVLLIAAGVVLRWYTPLNPPIARASSVNFSQTGSGRSDSSDEHGLEGGDASRHLHRIASKTRSHRD
jgi:hypothetical protein